MPEKLPAAALMQGLSKEQKFGFILLLIFAIITVGFGVLQIRNTLYAPFALNNKVAPNLKNEVNTIESLRLRDTDQDELNDFDELYIYKTSPYLYDTFSYGMSDKEVIAKNLPLCPKSQDCGSPIVSGGEIPVNASSSVLVALPRPEAPPDLAAMFKDPKKVRELLLSSGTDPKLINKVSDSDLMMVLNQVLSDTTTMKTLNSLNGLTNLPARLP